MRRESAWYFRIDYLVELLTVYVYLPKAEHRHSTSYIYAYGVGDYLVLNLDHCAYRASLACMYVWHDTYLAILVCFALRHLLYLLLRGRVNSSCKNLWFHNVCFTVLIKIYHRLDKKNIEPMMFIVPQILL